MLVIFDLDDTLIETSKCLTPHYLLRAYTAMQLPGAELSELIEMNERAINTKTAIKDFFSRYSDNKNIYQKGIDALKTPFPKGIPLQLVPGALELLDALSSGHTLALVTAGEPSYQLEKMKKAGIQPSRFSKLVVSDSTSKKFDYQTVLDQLSVAPNNAIVCGDRVSVDLSPAKALGMYTVHFRNGRGKFCDTPKEDVDMSIDALTQFYEVFSEHES